MRTPCDCHAFAMRSHVRLPCVTHANRIKNNSIFRIILYTKSLYPKTFCDLLGGRHHFSAGRNVLVNGKQNAQIAVSHPGFDDGRIELIPQPFTPSKAVAESESTFRPSLDRAKNVDAHRFFPDANLTDAKNKANLFGISVSVHLRSSS